MRTDRAQVLIYALVAGGPAAVGPFAALWLRGRGIAYDDIGVCLAAPLLLRLALCRPLAVLSSRFVSTWMPVALMCGAVGAASLICALSCETVLTLVAWCGLGLAANACMPLMDGAILDAASDGEGSGHLVSAKGTGAIAYLLAVPMLGVCLQHAGPCSLPLWSGAAACVACFGAGRLAISQTAADDRPIERTRMVRNPRSSGDSSGKGWFAVMVIAATLIETSHGIQSLAMIHWTAMGLTPELNGILWATGTLADVVFLWLGGHWLNRIAPSSLLAAGGMAAVLRWVGFAMDPPLPALFVLQALHALSFTATCLATVRLAHLWANRSEASRQLVTWATSTGFAGGVAILIAAPLYGAIGIRAYWIMALLAGSGLVLALFLHRGLHDQGRSSQFDIAHAF